MGQGFLLRARKRRAKNNPLKKAPMLPSVNVAAWAFLLIGVAVLSGGGRRGGRIQQFLRGGQ